MDFVERHIGNHLVRAMKSSPIVFLNGGRQTGKTTLTYEVAGFLGNDSKATYVSFDQPTMVAAATRSPEAFLEGYSKPLIIDEVQMVPELFRALKVFVDQSRLKNKSNANGNFLLTGSANILSLPKLSDSLVGRMTVLTLYPFSTGEAIRTTGRGLERIINFDFSDIKDTQLRLTEAIRLATYPEIAFLNEEDRKDWFDGYITTLLQREVRQIAELEKITLLPHLLRVLCVRAGGLINDSDIAREVGLSSPTTKLYRHILQMMFLAFDLRPWHGNLGKRLVKSAKGFLNDTCLLCHMLDIDMAEIETRRPELFGHILENYVATEIIKQISNHHLSITPYHFRTSDNKEVDFVLEKPNRDIIGIEIKNTELITKNDFKGLEVLAEETKKYFLGGIVLYNGAQVVPFGKKLWAIPIRILWE
ncbi:MAG: ATP-binding protein [Bacteroidota bacterium]|nr:ATP-binding protein [Bacteroidota bacterium]